MPEIRQRRFVYANAAIAGFKRTRNWFGNFEAYFSLKKAISFDSPTIETDSAFLKVARLNL
jgi:hypothetical protein